MKTNAQPIEGLPGMENLLTIADVARRHAVQPSAVYRAIHRGKLASAGALHGRLYINRSESEAWQPLTDNAERARKAGATRWAKAKNATAAVNAPNPSHPSEQSEQSEQSEGEA